MYFYITLGRTQFVITLGKRYAYIHHIDLTQEEMR
jgi:hypothetical protein